MMNATLFWEPVHVFYRKKSIRKWSSNDQNFKEIFRKSRGSISKNLLFIGQKSIFRNFCIYIVKDGIQIRLNKIMNESVIHFS